MKNLTKKFVSISALLTLSSIALVGCSTNEPAPTTAPTSSENTIDERQAASAETATIAANDFFSALLEEDTTDYSKLKLPLELTDAQNEQLMFEGKVDGVKKEELKELVDFLYANNPIGQYIHFEDNATEQERMQVLSILVISQSFASELSEEQTPEKILVEDVIIEDRSGKYYATFGQTDELLAPMLIFAKGEWKVDGASLLEGLLSQSESGSTENSGN